MYAKRNLYVCKEKSLYTGWYSLVEERNLFLDTYAPYAHEPLSIGFRLLQFKPSGPNTADIITINQYQCYCTAPVFIEEDSLIVSVLFS